jgi:hypothetical protein
MPQNEELFLSCVEEVKWDWTVGAHTLNTMGLGSVVKIALDAYHASRPIVENVMPGLVL